MSSQRPPHPNAHWLWGNMREFNGDTLAFIEQLATLGDVTSFRFGPFWGYFVNHPDFVHEVLVSTGKTFAKPRRVRWALEDITGDNLFTSDGEYWKKQRKLMQPSFHTQRIGAYADTMVEFAQREMASWQNGAEIDMDHAMTSVTMNIITRTMFDTEVGAETREIGEAFTDLFQYVNKRTEALFITPPWIPTADNRAVQQLTARVRKTVQRFIEERRASGEDKGDLLSMLLMAQDEGDQGMTDEQVINEAMIIFGAGHETTAYTLTFAWYALAQHPEIEAKLHEEVDRVLGGRPATLADLPRLQYAGMVIKETMRLFPPAWGITRDVVKDVEIGGYVIPKDSAILVSPWTLGRDARWFPHPQQFQPERFTPENEAKLPKYAYIPFGGGPRICIGNQFALMEAQLVLATIAQHYSFAMKPGFVTKPQRAFTLRPNNGMKMIAHVRERVPAL
jgi:cytochrome P450